MPDDRIKHIVVLMMENRSFDHMFGFYDPEGNEIDDLGGAESNLSSTLITTTDTAAGHAVPFYFQETLGGAGAVRGFNDEIIGTDGSKATLRGFDDLRFRGLHSMLLQVEYRWGVWGPIDATAFVDAGKVAMDRADLDFTNLKHDYGFSVSAMTGDATALRVDFGSGGGEGSHVFFSVGPIFAQ